MRNNKILEAIYILPWLAKSQCKPKTQINVSKFIFVQFPTLHWLAISKFLVWNMDYGLWYNLTNMGYALPSLMVTSHETSKQPFNLRPKTVETQFCNIDSEFRTITLILPQMTEYRELVSRLEYIPKYRFPYFRNSFFN